MTTPSFPTSVPTLAAMSVLSNNLASFLTADIDSVAVSLDLDDASSFPTSGEITIGTEAIHYTGKSTNTLTGLTRGYDNTSAAAHSAGDVANQYFIAEHHNRLAAEINAIAQNISDRFGLGQGAYTVLPVGIGIIFQPTAGKYFMITCDAEGVHSQEVTLS